MSYNLVADISDYEDGSMDEHRTVVFFQHLIDTGMAWELQGSYGRTAAALIRSGQCHTAADNSRRQQP